MDMRFISPLIDGDKEYYIYLDEETNKYYKTYEDEKIEVTEEELLELGVVLPQNFKVVSSKKSKTFKRVAIAILAGALLYAPIHNHRTDIKYVINQQNYVDDYDYLRNYQAGNDTLSYELQLKLPQYINVLAKLELKESTMVKIGNRLKRMDFTNKSEREVVEMILNLDDGGFVAAEFYAYINETPVPYKQAIISDLFTLEKDVVVRLINGESLNRVIKDIHGVSINAVELSDKDAEVVESLNIKIEEELGFVGKEFGCVLNNNIFEEYVRIGYGTHNFYGVIEEDGITNVTPKVYMKRLEDLVNVNAQYIDYQNQDDRFIVYLYANSLLFGDYFNFDIDIPELLYSGVMGNVNNIGKLAITQEELYSYLESPSIYRYQNVHYLSQLAYLGEMGIYILQEVNLCLVEDLKVGNINQAQYDAFIDSVINIYTNMYPELLDIFKDAALKNKSIDGFSIQLINPEV